ncbi:phage tail protein [Aerosakkonemataceae cyanobacterium BLCC-F154]|uniref:Phage tail protein n=1 Tax=Floridaenema fluviatile BLCC-F154 TaxID=3153640 RepID=A0ABV4YFB4_9CYAN
METFIGTIILFPNTYVPRGWAACNGQELSIMQNQALFSILGTTYGGNGTTAFALPNLPTVKDVDGKGESQYIICLYGIYPQRDW